MFETSSDLELLAAWGEGDQRAGNSLVKRHLSALHRFFSARAHAHVEDLIQQTLLACIESKQDFRSESTFRSYLFGLARLQLYLHYRKNRRIPLLDVARVSVEDLAPSPLILAAKQEDARRVEAALQGMSAEQRVVLEKAYWEDLTTPEIARALRVPQNTVHSRLHRGKQSLRRVLQRP